MNFLSLYKVKMIDNRETIGFFYFINLIYNNIYIKTYEEKIVETENI
jgi:hypothetical protein